LDDAWHKLERKRDQLSEEVRDQLNIQIQKEIINGVELIVGVKYDPTFGPVLLFGAGGSYAELIADRNLHLLPITKAQVEKLVKGSKVYKVLKGKDGEPPYALEKLYELILKLAKLSELVPEASDIEINPVILTLNDVWAVDAKVILKAGEHKFVSVPRLQVAKTVMHENLATQFHHFEFESEEPLKFDPGQYISVKVAPDAVRAYSIACHKGDNTFDLLVDTRPGGPGSKFFENLNEGDKMTYLGPFGVFALKPDDEFEHLIFMATGTGISAIRCMIESALDEHKITKPISLYFGLTHVEEIFWRDWLEETAKKYPNFKYQISVYQPETEWDGHTGFITDLVKKDFEDASKCSAYLCGHKAMIADAKELLLEKGCPEERIYTEKFV
jgi:ferredoxin-NADP reductase